MLFWTIFGVLSLVKLLFMSLYRSTDFEVHRNWLAITYSLPVSEWYTNESSPWTLDYPPFFAYFELLLAQVAQFVDAEMLQIDNHYYASTATVVFQRMSVVVVDLVLALGTRSFIQAYFGQWQRMPKTILAGTVLGNFGLLLVDHIHFQYNGILFGILLFSMAAIKRERFLLAALLFAVLLHMKHIFMYMAPVYVVYLLRFYCLENTDGWRVVVCRLCELAGVVLAVTALSFGPFVRQLPQLLARLFPFKRGLCHAYWAPNFWALYNMADKMAAVALGVRRTAEDGEQTREAEFSSNTGGLVQDYKHVVLPTITPAVTFVLCALAMLPCLIKLFRMTYNRKYLPKHFVRALVLCAGASFLFGWHVHEKAILMVYIPLSLLCLNDRHEANITFFLSFVAHYSLFPLLFETQLTVLKLTLYCAYNSFVGFGLVAVHGNLSLACTEIVYLLGFTMLYLYENGLQYVFGLNTRLPFLPLMMVSTYCAIGVLYFWLLYYWRFMQLSSSSSISTSSSRSTKKSLGMADGRNVIRAAGEKRSKKRATKAD